MMEPKFETGIKRVVTVTIIDEDVTRVEEILKTFALSGHKDRRLIGFAKRFLEKIESQRQQVKMLEYEDRRQAMQEWFQELDIDRAAEIGKKHKLDEQEERILELTNIVRDSKSDDLPALEA